jgi:hypothetical protein
MSDFVQHASPYFALLGVVVYAIMRWIDAFGKAAATEAGKAAGKVIGEVYTAKAARFGSAVSFGIIIGVMILGGLGLTVFGQDCQIQQSGFVLAAGGVGLAA